MTRLEKLQEFLKVDPADSFTRYAIALEHRSIGDLQSAVENFQALVESDPGYVATYYMLADCYRQQKNKEEALSCYKKGIKEARTANDLHAVSELQADMEEMNDEE